MDENFRFDTVGPLNWERLVEELDGLGDGWLFRGQQNAAWPLQTTLERHTPPGMSRASAEQQLLKGFRRRAHTYLLSHQVPTETGEWLALMQHFGAPTRLLDVTRSPFVATYFAAENVSEADKTCCVWAIHLPSCLDRCGSNFFAKYPERKSAVEEFAKARGLTISPEMMMGFAETLRAADDWFNESIPMVVPFEPDRLSERLSIQQAQFLVPRDLNLTFMENLNALGRTADLVMRFTLPYAQRGRALEQLRLMNVTRASLFPGLEGFAQSFRQELVIEPPEMKDLRLAIAGLRPGGRETPTVGESQS